MTNLSPAELRLLALKLEAVNTHPDERARLGRQAAEILYALADSLQVKLDDNAAIAKGKK